MSADIGSSVLMRTVMDCLAFLELSGDDVIDPDAAVGMIEAVAFELQKLPEPRRAAFVALALHRAAEQDDPRSAEFFRRLPEAIGL